MAVYTNPQAPFLSMLLVTAAFAAVNLPSVSVWTGFGMALRGFLADPAEMVQHRRSARGDAVADASVRPGLLAAYGSEA